MVANKNELSKISFKIIPILRIKDKPEIKVLWEQVRTIIDDIDILDTDNDFRWGMESYLFLNQKEKHYKGKLIIGVCTCCTEGHDDIAVDIDNSDDYVSWNIYYENNPEKHKFYTFDKNDYTKAIEEAISKITQGVSFLFILHKQESFSNGVRMTLEKTMEETNEQNTRIYGNIKMRLRMFYAGC